MSNDTGILPQYVIHGCVADASGNVSQVEADKEHLADFFGLYEAHEEGGHALEWLSDHASRHEAEEAKAALLIPLYRISPMCEDCGDTFVVEPKKAQYWALYEIRSPGDTQWGEDLFEVGQYKSEADAVKARDEQILANGTF